MSPPKWTVSKIRALKRERKKLVCLTAYDYATARLVDGCGAHLILVGDSLAMTVLGYKTTLPVTMEEMLHHTTAVVRGVEHALVVADMPFMSYQASVDQALKNAGRFIKDAGADAVKIEGGALRAETVRTLVGNGIPVLGHIGLTPQSVLALGGYKVQGRKPKEVKQLVADAAALEKAGVFAIVLECVPRQAGRLVTARARVPTIGIGAGPDCDGQILVINDMLGFYGDITPRFVKRYANLGRAMAKAVETYKREVEHGAFPSAEHCY